VSTTHEEELSQPERLSVWDNLVERGYSVNASELAAHHGATIGGMLGRDRMRESVRARHDLWSLMASRGLSTTEIGKLVDRDATTVADGIRAARRRRRYAEAEAAREALAAKGGAA